MKVNWLKVNVVPKVRRDFYVGDLDIDDDILYRLFLRDYMSRRPGKIVDINLLRILRSRGFGNIVSKYAPTEGRFRRYYTVFDVVEFIDGAVHYKPMWKSMRVFLDDYGYSEDDIVSVGGIDWRFYKQYIKDLQDFIDRKFYSFNVLRRVIMEKEEILDKISKDELAKELLRKRIEDNLDDLVDAAIDLARGYRLKKGDKTYDIPPDKDMLKYLLDHYFGKPILKKMVSGNKVNQPELKVNVMDEG